MSIIRKFKDIQNNALSEPRKANQPEYKRAIKCKDSDKFYKYMDMETAIKCLSNSSIRFVEPSSWQDKYERRFYKADYSKIPDGNGNSPFLYAHCVTTKRNNAAAWQIYTYGKVGLGARCVQFVIDKKAFRSQLLSSLDQTYSIYEGEASYLSTEEINALHKKDSLHYDDIFINYTLEKYLSLLLVKRNDFIFEEEVRLFIIPNKTNVKNTHNPQYVDITVDWPKVLKEIRVDSSCTDVEFEMFKNICSNIIDKRKIKKYNVYGKQERIAVEA